MHGQLDTLVAETVEEAESVARAYSPWAVTARHFLSNRLAMVGLAASLALIGVGVWWLIRRRRRPPIPPDEAWELTPHSGGVDPAA